MIRIKDISLDELYWYFKLGRPKYKITTNELIFNINKYIQQPVFFLSTGRCGTKWFSELLMTNKSNAVFHAPKPALDRQSRIAYELFSENNFNIDKNYEILLKELFLSNREQHLRYTYKTGKRYIETNNYITFFAPVLYKIFPDAKFVHLTRNPLQFIKSGLNRKYYTNRTEDSKRITPVKSSINWNTFSNVEKIAWLWNETNEFIEQFKDKFNTQVYHFDFNQLNVNSVKELINFLEMDISSKKIQKLLPQKLNAQKQNIVNADDLVQKNKEKIINICGTLSAKYKYEF